jgi:hypothetical protein
MGTGSDLRCDFHASTKWESRAIHVNLGHRPLGYDGCHVLFAPNRMIHGAKAEGRRVGRRNVLCGRGGAVANATNAGPRSSPRNLHSKLGPAHWRVPRPSYPSCSYCRDKRQPIAAQHARSHLSRRCLGRIFIFAGEIVQCSYAPLALIT